MTIQEALQLAVQHHQAGRLPQAEQLYRSVLTQSPNNPDALNLLGVIARQAGQPLAAIKLIEQAILHRPGWAEAQTNLGNALKDAGRMNDAIAAFRQSVALNPSFADGYNNLGSALCENGQQSEAMGLFRQALALKPDYPEAMSNLGVLLLNAGQVEESIALLQRAVAIRPGFADAHCHLGDALMKRHQPAEAIAAYRTAIACNPRLARGYCNLGNALLATGRIADAADIYRRAIALEPAWARLHSNLGTALKDLGQITEAIACYRRAVELEPKLAESVRNLSNALRSDGQIDEAITTAQRAIELKNDSEESWSNLGNALIQNGRIDEALEAYSHAAALNPANAAVNSNYIFSLHYDPDTAYSTIQNELAKFNRQHAEAASRPIHTNDPNPDRRLRIGYVSADLREHPVGRFMLPLLTEHDKTNFEIFAYAAVPVGDAVTDRLRVNVHHWRNITGLPDAQVVQLIEGDGIDILVDLAVHSGQNKLPVFAAKPAPVQVTWLGYPGSTGLETVDYRLSDPYLDLPGMDESIYAEKTIRLPDTFWCYEAGDAAGEVGPLPADSRGHITFGCLGNFSKLSRPTLQAWVKILQSVPASHLLLHANPGSSRDRLRSAFGAAGIATDRIEFEQRTPLADYFRLYDRIDIGLDTFPFAGGTTTCDALWMGVPVVSLIGKMAVGRGGFSILSNVGLSELTCRDVESYIATAIDLAHDLSRLRAFRASLRDRMQNSALTAAPRFAREMESVYRAMWREWTNLGRQF